MEHLRGKILKRWINKLDDEFPRGSRMPQGLRPDNAADKFGEMLSMQLLGRKTGVAIPRLFQRGIRS